MICKYCGGTFRSKNHMYCPYCDMELPKEELQEKENTEDSEIQKNGLVEEPTLVWDLDKLTETRILAERDKDEVCGKDEACGTVKITVKGNKNLLSPATGTNYVMMFDGEAYQVRLTKGDQDISETLELPVGKHEGILKIYSWSDECLENPETPAKGMITIDVRQNTTTEIVIKTGALSSLKTLKII